MELFIYLVNVCIYLCLSYIFYGSMVQALDAVSVHSDVISARSVCEPVAGSCEHVNKPSV
jgi:hypothetical protein